MTHSTHGALSIAGASIVSSLPGSHGPRSRSLVLLACAGKRRRALGRTSFLRLCALLIGIAWLLPALVGDGLRVVGKRFAGSRIRVGYTVGVRIPCTTPLRCWIRSWVRVRS